MQIDQRELYNSIGDSEMVHC